MERKENVISHDENKVWLSEISINWKGKEGLKRYCKKYF
jgi:hypothetical protein